MEILRGRKFIFIQRAIYKAVKLTE